MHGKDHPTHLQHHFDTPLQQFDSAKLGMWLFLATEILLFGGLFCAYAVYRGNHPEIFMWSHHLLDTRLGAINTVILLCSSLTMAWAVRCSQLGQQRGLIILLLLTLSGGFGFLGIKYVEYSSKYKHGLLWGAEFQPDPHYLAEHFGLGPGAVGHHDDATPGGDDPHEAERPAAGEAATTGHDLRDGVTGERSTIAPAAAGPLGRAPATEATAHAMPQPQNVHVFFSIYFLMTGLHGLHVVAGMAVLAWLILGAIRGRFSSDYFTPVDLGGLYWHLVDLIWIFLFPLLYLIH
ncbi:MAG TPA: cytochrome c oxidase subunit 3 [Candidatus Polarisedimenticolaceae bacterium]|nr:cytochrome c oxidase subunit 3 [Candidatus Polarisedimenticolaceae bacterium]